MKSCFPGVYTIGFFLLFAAQNLQECGTWKVITFCVPYLGKWSLSVYHTPECDHFLCTISRKVITFCVPYTGMWSPSGIWYMRKATGKHDSEKSGKMPSSKLLCYSPFNIQVKWLSVGTGSSKTADHVNSKRSFFGSKTYHFWDMLAIVWYLQAEATAYYAQKAFETIGFNPVVEISYNVSYLPNILLWSLKGSFLRKLMPRLQYIIQKLSL